MTMKKNLALAATAMGIITLFAVPSLTTAAIAAPVFLDTEMM